MDETLGAFDKLIKQGKVRVIGASNYNGARLRQALETSRQKGIARYETLQPNYSLMEREGYESDLAPVIADSGIGVIPYFSLAAGFLTGKYRSETDLQGKARAGIVGKYLNAKGLAVLAALDAVAKEYNSTPASVALAWLIAQPGITAPIASATSEKHLHDLVAATELRLGKDAVARLTQASDSVAA